MDLSILNDFTDLCVWKKDIHLNFVDINETAAHVFGFDSPKNAIGKSDFDIPSGLSNFANTFRMHDTNVIKHNKKLRFLEIQPCVNDEWKILHVVKQPYYKNGSLAGVLGYSLDITKSYLNLEEYFVDSDLKVNKLSVPFKKNSESHPQLRLRESECLFFLLRKCTAKDIANILHLSSRTIEDYIDVLKEKFFCKSKSELIQRAKELGFFYIIPPTIIRKQLSIIIE